MTCPVCGHNHYTTVCLNQFPVPVKVEIIEQHPARLTKEELVRQLQEYGCPTKIIEDLQQWILDCFFDNTKLGKWISGGQ